MRMAERLSTGDQFPDLTVETAEGEAPLREHWQQAPLVVAFERHFG